MESGTVARIAVDANEYFGHLVVQGLGVHA
jgi:hypothetical protein